MRSFQDIYTAPLPKDPFWIEGGVLPKGGRMLIAGDTGTFKSYLALSVAHHLAAATPLWSIAEFSIPRPVRALYIDQEIGDVMLQKRLKEIYAARGIAPHDGLYAVSMDPELELDQTRGRQKLEQYIEQSQARVVIVDVISQAMWGSEVSNDDIKRLVHQLEFAYDRFRSEGLAFVLVHHSRKPPASSRDAEDFDPLDHHNVRGAGKWVGSVDTAVMVTEEPASQTKAGEWRRLQVRWAKRRHAEKDRQDRLAIRAGGIPETVRQSTLRPG